MVRIEEELVSSFKSEQQKAMLNILFTANWLRNRQVEFFKPFGLSPQQYNILRILRGAKGERRSMQQVKQRMIDRAPNATRLTDKLIAKGLVERERCEEDRRVVYLRIARNGLELLSRIDRKYANEERSLRSWLSDDEARALNEFLDRMRA
ncbi:MAG: MarR family transcriptional regulator [Flavobacteriales bacterium]|nr:MarR family transcriptional regulator [Flavobacteriales bacterium]MCB0783734.1 MarR family transcriptional regulator [Flavobacteriales bacterium]MCB0789580.1 MarR family transcriptional regulator [Flavobacteriales bacterium]MCB0809020.1 MarR family transcriptional regulator [Flavobacteriales bacterium]MCB0813380.1 MarR family transcriptional regulator [Flavobacteriales bacterium]